MPTRVNSVIEIQGRPSEISTQKIEWQRTHAGVKLDKEVAKVDDSKTPEF